MGWDFAKGATKKSVINSIKLSWGTRLKASFLAGSEFWTVVDSEEEGPVIVLYLLAKQRGYGYGYKAMDERAHPFYYRCPVSFFDLAPERSAEWRKAVRLNAQVHTGSTVTVNCDGYLLNATLKVTKVRGNTITVVDMFGKLWRVDRAHITSVS